MSLSNRQQAVLDQMDRALGTADPQLQSKYAAFTKRTGGAPFPAAEVIGTRQLRHLVLALIFLLALGILVLGITTLNGHCTAGRGTCSTSTVTRSKG
jgi:Protein of unknown function (DUF3040)